MKFAKVVFLVAGIYGFLVLTPIYFMESAIGRLTPPAITHPEYFYGFLGAGLTWQLVFLVISKDPQRYRALIAPSILEKVSYGGCADRSLLAAPAPAFGPRGRLRGLGFCVPVSGSIPRNKAKPRLRPIPLS